MKAFFLISFFSIFNFVYIFAQGNVFSYNFDDCTFEDAASSFPGITPVGNPACVCGLQVQSYELDGGDDHFSISSQANIHFQNNFTFDFYFFIKDEVGEIDIFSHRNGCGSLDSLMSLRYFSSNNEVLFEIASNVNNYHSAKAKLDRSICWHRFTLVKFNLEYLVYLDNKLIKSIIARENVSFSKLTNLFFANSPCVSPQSKKFKGQLDEIVLYNRALSELELKNLYSFPDQIATQNTTIFKGESIRLNAGTSCAGLIEWSPATGLNNINSLDPLATPEVTTTYTLTLTNSDCISTDTVRIYVADKDKLDCNNLLLPKAFTPNNDGLNDRFGISNTFLVDDLSYFEIYDRWGAKVWETANAVEMWDGTFKDQPLNNGMYLYKIKYTCGGNEKLNIDNFNLLR